MEAIRACARTTSGGKSSFSPTNNNGAIMNIFYKYSDANNASAVCDVNGWQGSMIILWSVLLAATSAHKVVESTEDIGPEAFINVTTLYPVINQQTNNHTNIIDKTNATKTENVDTEKDLKEEKPKTDATSWKIEAAFAESKLEKDNNAVVQKVEQKNETKEFKPSQHLGSFLDSNDLGSTRENIDSLTPVVKKPVSGFVGSKEVYRSFINKTPKELLHNFKEYPYKFEYPTFTKTKDRRPDQYKPWAHGTPGLEGLGNRPGKEIGNVGIGSLGRPGKGWGISSLGIDGTSGEKPGKYGGHLGYATSGENPANDWVSHQFDTFDRPNGWDLDSLEPKPTIEAPVMVPAGGLYQYPNPFKVKPANHNGNFGLDFNDVKDQGVVKRGPPWEGILRMLAAFLPVGLIISALAPSIITIENTASDSRFPSNEFRRTDPDPSGLPAISEQCKRRLLCELHNDKHYSNNEKFSPRKWKQCHRIRCEDPSALETTLRWLLHRQMNRQT